MKEITINYCEFCDSKTYPEELVKWKGRCKYCGKDTARIAVLRREPLISPQP